MKVLLFFMIVVDILEALFVSGIEDRSYMFVEH